MLIHSTRGERPTPSHALPVTPMVRPQTQTQKTMPSKCASTRLNVQLYVKSLFSILENKQTIEEDLNTSEWMQKWLFENSAGISLADRMEIHQAISIAVGARVHQAVEALWAGEDKLCEKEKKPTTTTTTTTATTTTTTTTTKAQQPQSVGILKTSKKRTTTTNSTEKKRRVSFHPDTVTATFTLPPPPPPTTVGTGRYQELSIRRVPNSTEPQIHVIREIQEGEDEKGMKILDWVEPKLIHETTAWKRKMPCTGGCKGWDKTWQNRDVKQRLASYNRLD